MYVNLKKLEMFNEEEMGQRLKNKLVSLCNRKKKLYTSKDYYFIIINDKIQNYINEMSKNVDELQKKKL